MTYAAAPLLRPYANLARGVRYHYLGNPQIKPEVATQYSASIYRNRISDHITGQPMGAFIGGLPVKQAGAQLARPTRGLA